MEHPGSSESSDAWSSFDRSGFLEAVTSMMAVVRGGLSDLLGELQAGPKGEDQLERIRRLCRDVSAGFRDVVVLCNALREAVRINPADLARSTHSGFLEAFLPADFAATCTSFAPGPLYGEIVHAVFRQHFHLVFDILVSLTDEALRRDWGYTGAAVPRPVWDADLDAFAISPSSPPGRWRAFGAVAHVADHAGVLVGRFIDVLPLRKRMAEDAAFVGAMCALALTDRDLFEAMDLGWNCGLRRLDGVLGTLVMVGSIAGSIIAEACGSDGRLPPDSSLRKPAREKLGLETALLLRSVPSALAGELDSPGFRGRRALENFAEHMLEITGRDPGGASAPYDEVADPEETLKRMKVSLRTMAMDRTDRCDGCGSVRKGGELRKCGGCGTARYCGTECQRAAWAEHKGVCRRASTRTESRPVLLRIRRCLGGSST
ncbi:hypothetical protein DFJ74DRAFT_295981 [Hyaloraphidium curvatum]|nr:hypothetical protein DFJ74DRAFT_295981 [Hyaloraphidium curvatum]